MQIPSIQLQPSMETPPTLNVPDLICAEQVPDLTRSVLAELAENRLSEAKLEQILTAVFQVPNGAREFLTAYLPDQHGFADLPSSGLLAALHSAPEVVSDILVKTLAMSGAMLVIHQRNQDQALAQGSERVLRRTIDLLHTAALPPVPEKLQQMQASLENGTGVYQAFLERWEYDPQQKQLILQQVRSAIQSLNC